MKGPRIDLRRLLPVIACALSLLISSTAHPDDDKAEQTADIKAAVFTDPSLTALAQDEQPQVTLEASKDGSVAAGKVGFRFGDWTTSLVFRAPVTSGQTEVDLANLDGLTAKTSGSLSLTWKIPVAKKKLEDQEEPGAAAQQGGLNSDKLIRACSDYNADLMGKIREHRPNWSPIDIKKNECTFERLIKADAYWANQARQFKAGARAETCLEFNLSTKDQSNHFSTSQFVLDSSTDGDAGNPQQSEPEKECTDQNIELQGKRWIELYREKLKKKLEPLCKGYNDLPSENLINLHSGACKYSTLKNKGPKWQLKGLRASAQKPWFLTFDLSGSQSEFSFIDPSNDFKEHETQETNYGASVALGTFRSGINYSLSYRHETVFKGADEVELCRPIPGTGAFSCIETAVEGPTEINRKIIGLDVKSFFIPMVAGNLRVLYDFEQRFWNPHLYFFFIPTKGKGLNFGVDVSYSTLKNDEGKKEGVAARLFLGAAFKVGPTA